MEGNVIATIFVALMLIWVCRNEEGYAWWKALLVALAGSGISILVGNLPGMSQSWLAWVGIAVVAVAVAGVGRLLLKMSWRDAGIVGVGFVFVQAVTSILLAMLL